MESEHFYKTLEKIWFSDVSWFTENETDYLKKVIHCLYTYGSFLDAIPIDERNTIAYKLLRIIEDIHLNNFRKSVKKDRNPVKPSEKINSYLNTIISMKEILENEGLTHEILKNSDNTGLNFVKFDKNCTYDFLCELQRDLETQSFKYFDRYSFNLQKSTKENIESYMKHLVELYQIPKSKTKAENLATAIYKI